MHVRITFAYLSALAVILALSITPAVGQTAAEGAALGNAGAANGVAVQQPLANASQQLPAAQAAAPAGQTSTQPAGQTAAPAEQQAPPQVQAGPAPLRVMVGKSILVNTADRLRRVSVTDPSVADALVVTPTQVLVHGRGPGEVSLLLWDEQERSRSFDLRVDVDTSAAGEEIHRIFPEERIDVGASRNALVLSGHVGTEDTAKRAGLVASAYSKNVINVLSFGPQGAQEVLLEVKFAEINRVALQQLGVNILSTGATNTVGTIGTGQFGASGTVDLTGQIPGRNTGFTTNFPAVDPLNLFVFRPDLNLGLAIKALQTKSLLQILAEPNLIAVNGKEASFLAGGEFPIPIAQGGTVNAVTIQYKEFGVRLNFTPTIMPNGNIHLQVKPEVSSLDFANALRFQGFVIPSLTTRRAATELELQDGQSFIIAGLMDNRLVKDMNKIPGLGDIPILGNFFKSRSVNKTKDELMVLVTARRIQPSAQPAPLPKFPDRFLDQAKPATGGAQ